MADEAQRMTAKPMRDSTMFRAIKALREATQACQVGRYADGLAEVERVRELLREYLEESGKGLTDNV